MAHTQNLIGKHADILTAMGIDAGTLPVVIEKVRDALAAGPFPNLDLASAHTPSGSHSALPIVRTAAAGMVI